MMTPGSLIAGPAAMAPVVAGTVAAALDPAAVAAVVFLPGCDRAAKAEPSLTARIDGVEMDFCRVRMRGESHLLGSPPAFSLDKPLGLAGKAAII